MNIVVVGGGWSGCAAALSAHKQGAEVLLIERTDMLLGTGLVGGIMRNNGRFTAADTQTTVEVLRIYVIGLPFAAVDQMLVFASYARKDTWRPALAGVISIVTRPISPATSQLVWV